VGRDWHQERGFQHNDGRGGDAKSPHHAEKRSVGGGSGPSSGGTVRGS
jgi:hypothetical protein